MKITKDSLKELIKEELDLYTEEEIPNKQDVIDMYKDIKKYLYMKYMIRRDRVSPKELHPARGVVAEHASDLFYHIEDKMKDLN
jgi:hypothetical protein